MTGDASKVSAFPLMLLRGTEMHRRRDELRLRESTEVRAAGTERLQECIPHVVAHPSMTVAEDGRDLRAGGMIRVPSFRRAAACRCRTRRFGPSDPADAEARSLVPRPVDLAL